MILTPTSDSAVDAEYKVWLVSGVLARSNHQYTSNVCQGCSLEKRDRCVTGKWGNMPGKSSGRTRSARAKTPTDRAGGLARQIWLAGVGAYGQALDETQEQVTRRVAQVSKDTTKLFDDLVSRGNDLEQKLGELGALGKMSAEAGAKKLRESAEVSLSLEDRLARMRDMLGLASSGSDIDLKLERLQSDVKALNKKVDVLIELQGGPVKKKTSTRKKAPARKKTSAKKKTVSAKKSVKRT